MRIMRDYLGGSEVIDLGTSEGREYFVNIVTQDEDAADEIIARLFGGEDEIVINESEPEFIERYTVIS